MELVSIGFGNVVVASRVMSIVSPESVAIKRVVADTRDRGQLIDATYGRRTRAVIIMNSGHILLSSVHPETMTQRFSPSSNLHNLTT